MVKTVKMSNPKRKYQIKLRHSLKGGCLLGGVLESEDVGVLGAGRLPLGDFVFFAIRPISLAGSFCNKQGEVSTRRDSAWHILNHRAAYVSIAPPFSSSEHAPVAQLVERFHGKEEVTGSIPVGSSSPF